MQDKEVSGTLVQQKIKKMLQSKRRLNKKDQPDLLKRMKSNQEQEEAQSNQDITEKKPTSSLKKRSSSVKNVQSESHILIPDSSTKPEIDLLILISNAFQHGPKMKEFIKVSNIAPVQIMQKLQENNLFMLSLQSKLQNINPEKHGQRTEKELIKKIQKMMLIEQQELACQIAEKKITDLIDKRIKQLKQY